MLYTGHQDSLKDAHAAKAPSNKTLMKSIRIDIWIVRTSNQLFKRFLYLTKIFKNIK